MRTSPLSLFSHPTPSTDQAAQAPITYSTEQYGSWQAFTMHPDFAIAKTQYKQIFAKIIVFIDHHCLHAAPIKSNYADFLKNIQTGLFTSRETLLYGEGKAMFTTFYSLLNSENISLEKRITAVINLAQELVVCVEGAINSLVMAVQQLRYAHEHTLISEAKRVREQLIEQLIVEFVTSYSDDQSMEKHHVAAYYNYLGERYALPSLKHDSYANLKALNITEKHLQECAEYIEKKLANDLLTLTQATTYLNEIHCTLPSKKVATLQDWVKLADVKAILAPIYGEIPDTALLIPAQENGEYYLSPVPTLIQLAIRQNLHKEGFLIHTPVCLYQYQAPSTHILINEFDPQQSQFQQKKQIISGETITIWHADTLYWVEIVGENTPTLLTLSHLPPLLSQHALAKNLIQSALVNSSFLGEAEKDFSVWISNEVYFAEYINKKFIGQAAFQIIEPLFRDFSTENVTRATLHPIFTQLGLEYQFTLGSLKDISTIKLVTLLAKTVEKLITSTQWTLIEQEMSLQNLLLLGVDHQILDKDGNTPLMYAACQGWLAVVATLLDVKVNINQTNHRNQTTVMLAALHGHLKIVEKLYINGADLALVSNLEGNALAHAVIGRQLPMVEFLLAQRHIASNLTQLNPTPHSFSYDINACSRHGHTALLWLFKNVDKGEQKSKLAVIQSMLQLLLAHGAADRIRGRSLLTLPGVYAYQCLDILLQANVRWKEREIFPILCTAITCGTLKDIKNLLQLGMPIYTEKNWEIDNEDCPITEAILCEEWDKGVLLLAHAQPTLTHFLRTSLLYLLIQEEVPKEQAKRFLPLILDQNFLSQPDPVHHTFFDGFIQYAETNQELTTMDLLKQLHFIHSYASVLLPLANEDTILMHLIKHGYSAKPLFVSVIHYLATIPALFNKQDKEGLMPFGKALQMGDMKAMEILLRASAKAAPPPIFT
jgi:hypothetical protein